MGDRWSGIILGFTIYWWYDYRVSCMDSFSTHVDFTHHHISFSSKENKKIYGSVLGIVTSVVAIIPFVGMVMHIITGILLLVDANNQQKQQNNKDISITSNNQEIN